MEVIERYSFEPMLSLWSERHRYECMVKVEVAVAWAQAELGIIPKEAYQKISQRAYLNLPKMKQIEKKTKHDAAALVFQLEECVGPEGRWIHFGLTSYDIVDTALGLILRDASKIIEKDITDLLQLLGLLAEKYKLTPIMGRTHGIYAEVMSFGLKLLLWQKQLERNLERFRAAAKSVSVGKISGAVGNYVHMPPKLEELVLERLNLGSAGVTSQIIARDRHAQFITTLAIIATSIEQFATEIRHLQRNEVAEVKEDFQVSQQVGSSAMPHKSNPIVCERLCGLARVIRAHAFVALENMVLWHERDITHSSSERIILSESCILTDYILKEFKRVLENLKVNPQQMYRNIINAGDTIFSQALMLVLIERGLSRQSAYYHTQRLIQQALDKNESLKDIVLKDEEISQYVDKDRLEECFSIDYYLRNIPYIFEKIAT